MNKCPNCGTEFEGRFCPECGAEWLNEKFCSKCGTKLPGSARFCNNCGYAFYSQAAPTPQSSPARKKRARGSAHAWFKTHKKLVVVLSIVLVMVIVLAIALPIGIYNRHNGTYYYYENEQFDEKQYFKLSGRIWTDEDGESGTFTLKGNEITFYQEVFGSDVELTSGTVKKGVLTLSIFGAEVTYAKKGAVHVHEYKQWTVVTPSTCIKQGVEQSTCKCGKTETRLLPLKEHQLSNYWLSDEATHWKVCSVCQNKADEAPHNFGKDGYCDTCAQTNIGLVYTLIQSYDRAYYALTSVPQDVREITIPSAIGKEQIPVASIGEGACKDCNNLTSVTIPDSVTEIGRAAFSGCNGLKSIIVPKSVTSIGDWAFFDCGGLTNIIIPNSVTSIGKSALGECSRLESVVWNANNCTTAGSSSNPLFVNCADLITVTFGENVKTIPDFAFYTCGGLTSITIPDNVTSIGESAFRKCSGLESITIPFVGAKKDGTQNTNFGYIFGASSDFYNINYVPTSLKTVIITGGSSIGAGAFSGCSGLTSVTIGSGVTSIGNWAFDGCSGLTGTLAIPEGVTSIGSFAFDGCSGLTSVTIGGGVTSIGGSAFSNCSGLTSITIPDSMTSIGSYAFAFCAELQSITIGSEMAAIREGVFDYCKKLTSVYYNGTNENWDKIKIGNNNESLTSATRYYFTEDKPTEEEWASWEYWWHYDETTSLPTPWKKENQ